VRNRQDTTEPAESPTSQVKRQAPGQAEAVGPGRPRQPPAASTTMVTVLPRDRGSHPAAMADAMAFATSSGATLSASNAGPPNRGCGPGGNSSTASRCPSL